MARGIHKHIIDSKAEFINVAKKVGVENIKSVSGIREAWSPITHETRQYRTIYHHVRAEFEVSERLFQELVKANVFVVDE